MVEIIDLTVVAAITTGLVEVLKVTRGLDKLIEGREKLLALLIAVVIATFSGLGVVVGVVAGLTSLGLYDAGMKTLKDGVKNLVG